MGRIGLAGRHLLKTGEETFAFGVMVAQRLPKQAILALSGPLGAGKTTFVQGLAQGLGITEPIQSPTFILLNVYDGLAHFDLYRLKHESDFTNLGFEEYLNAQMVCAIEWPERISHLLPSDTLHIRFEYGEGGRIAHVL
ncbi:MAG: tRNA (adenosine(37)-N6)-threonylcarbamoyltransferase complex ATPase subunit type 1 TsaE [Verrucomicrobia bacterium]|nr:tRNA (adenosine(37)-N6)-threonylcarbamoyltransferase complex ATPase subunit type 1 TsaE [Verrucomicrobiota bacterium]MBU6445909.1 tRNA (adenosine(37)-N6)-threonylcarbamoyltransferase complex ATPase subunit type 1 TsaE [Verrucomicrobiota bacterium]MDE3047744.1 tRNA (adenosine(37)-N6)-threonylcarbamoyltransferase complex ATPase subunit type 1 TsaE [Verrucomicrobiota bacterium]